MVPVTTVHVGYGPKSKHVLSLDLMSVKAQDLQKSTASFKLGQHKIEVEYKAASVDSDVAPVVVAALLRLLATTVLKRSHDDPLRT